MAPAYDLTFAAGQGYTRFHQMTIGGKNSGITRDDLLSVATKYGVPRAEEALDEVVQVVQEWPRFAASCKVPTDVIAKIQSSQARSGLVCASIAKDQED